MRRRQGFTITELLVAMALIIFIMYILAEAFSAGAGAFRKLKAIGDMNEKLRSTSTILRRYLQADHFEGKKRLSDADFWREGPPREGFLRIWNGSQVSTTDPTAYYYLEGNDLENNPSYRAVDHALHFAVKLRGNNRGDFFRVGPLPTTSPLLSLPGQDTRFQEASTYCSPWAEVAFFLRDSGEVSEDPESTQASQKLYTLYLRQRACVPDNSLVTTQVPATSYADYVETSCYVDPKTVTTPPEMLYFNGPADLTMPARRMNPALNGTNTAAAAATADLASSQAPYLYRILEEDPPTGARYGGNDILLTNVLSFEVRVMLHSSQATPDFLNLHHTSVQAFTNSNTQFSQQNGPRVFDTWSGAKDDTFDYTTWSTGSAATSIPLFQNTSGQRIRIVAIQITIRIWDSNTKQTRQTSIVVDM